MKKLITNPRPSEIHIDELHDYCIIFAKEKGKIIGVIYKDGMDQWSCTIPSEHHFITNDNNNLSELLSDCSLEDCEFYVLD